MKLVNVLHHFYLQSTGMTMHLFEGPLDLMTVRGIEDSKKTAFLFIQLALHFQSLD